MSFYLRILRIVITQVKLSQFFTHMDKICLEISHSWHNSIFSVRIRSFIIKVRIWEKFLIDGFCGVVVEELMSLFVQSLNSWDIGYLFLLLFVLISKILVPHLIFTLKLVQTISNISVDYFWVSRNEKFT